MLLRPLDFDTSVAFYEEGLGLVRYREWGARPHRGVVFFLGGGFLELAEGAGRAPAGVRLWLQVADAEEAWANLRARGVDILEPPERKPWGLIELSINDPDGLEIVVVETPPDHPLRRRQD